jgi:hypothetical protein
MWANEQLYPNKDSDMSTNSVVIPDVHLTVDQLIGAVRQLGPDARARVAQALLANEMDERFRVLIGRLANKTPAPEISETEIADEIRAVRRQNQSS